LIIGLMGFLGSGKSTVTNVLRSYKFVPESFAAPLKDSVSIIFGWDRDLLEGDTKESREFREQFDTFWSNEFGWSVTPRKILQMMGTEAVRNGIHDKTWISSCKNRILKNPNKNYVVSDVRFLNEIKAIQDMGGFIVDVINTRTEPVWLKPVKDQLTEWDKIPLVSEVQIPTLDQINEIQKKYPGAHYSEWARFVSPGYKANYIINNNGTLDELYANIHTMLNVFLGPTGVNLPLQNSFSVIN